MSYAGTGTVKPNWQQAQNLISQQTQIIIAELVESQRVIEKWRSAHDNMKAQLDNYKREPNAYTEGWYVKELGKERERRYTVESNLRRAQEFMRLKDRAKIKVERARDEALRKVKNLEDINTLLRTREQAQSVTKETNERQAIAWKEAELRAKRFEEAYNRQVKENERLLEVLRLGREGLRAEQW